MSKRVWIVMPVLHVGGTEIQTLQLVKVLKDAAYDVTVCCYYEYDGSMMVQFRDAGAAVHLMKYDRASGLGYLLKGMIQLFKSEKPDIVHVQYLAPGLIPIIAARVAGVKKVFATIHQPGFTFGWRERCLIRIALMLSTTFFCVSCSVEESWFGSSEVFDPERPQPRKHSTIYNAVDTKKITCAVQSADRACLRKTLGVDGKKVIGFVGRISREKGLDILIDAMPFVLSSNSDAVLMIAGDGPDRKRLEQRVESLGINNNIVWLGQKAPNEVYALYGIMDVLAVPSRIEGFGLSAAEAMAAGVPVVASGTGGLNEIIERGLTGFVVKNNSKTFAETLSKLLNNPSDACAIGQQAVQRVNGMFSTDRFAESVLRAYSFFAGPSHN